MGHGDSSQGFFSTRGLLQGSVPFSISETTSILGIIGVTEEHWDLGIL